MDKTDAFMALSVEKHLLHSEQNGYALILHSTPEASQPEAG